ncbi:MAG: tripartite tricarboxylate transporter substrate binding protein [Casimicrobiaceae bacterium]|nr:tripartite tricarboxylate transporter substrate binding protein [Casimicrobiaceae bacterium]MCX8097411.1 tripartite tricarboxylate transporter substrate binding protein [Casimicrobiaceae bacterium]MDW8312045.1 tripartite tricarboxylate transporter substrate binding protein [Burkholderiales bacterium]
MWSIPARTLGAVLLCAVVTGAQAQNWPSKTVTIVVPFPPGGTTDVLARAVAQKLAPAIGQAVIVENKPGAGATLGAAQVAKAAPDGHTLLMGAVHHTIAQSVYKNLPYKFETDFAPISTVAVVPNVLVVSAKAPYQNVRELVSAAKAKPGGLSYGSNGNGTAQHVIGTLFQQNTGTQIVHVPYRGSAPLTTDLLGGQVDLSFDTITPVLPFIKEGRLRPLAVTTPKRASALPDVPTLQEAGVPGIAIGTWFGLLAPAGTPREIVQRLNAEVVKIVQSADFRKQMADIGAEPVGNSPQEMAQQIREESAKFAALVKSAGIKLE